MSATDLLTLHVADEAQMARFAARTAPFISAPARLALIGDLGAGKTSWARSLIRALCQPDEEVLSPTFMLQQSYQTRRGEMLHHFDLYRVKNPAELVELGFEESLEQAICLIEWPQVAQHLLPDDCLQLRFHHNHETAARNVVLASASNRWQSLINHFKEQPAL